MIDTVFFDVESIEFSNTRKIRMEFRLISNMIILMLTVLGEAIQKVKVFGIGANEGFVISPSYLIK